MEGQQGLRCGEANPDQGLGGTSGQKPNADALFKRETEHLFLRPSTHGIGRDPFCRDHSYDSDSLVVPDEK